ncbi:MAG: GNAT family N-acetyltransferase [Candidatus Sericytochromatia bacterium]
MPIHTLPQDQKPQLALSDPYHQVILQNARDFPREDTRFYSDEQGAWGVFHPDTGFGYDNPHQSALTSWAQWLCDERIPLLAGELHSHYALLQTMGQILPEDGPLQVLCRYELQDFCIHTGPLPELPESPLRLRRAIPADVDRLFHFYQRSETMQARSRESLLHTITHHRLYYLQKMGKLVSAALTHCESQEAALIGGVYTPKAYRGKGFGQLCVRGLMQALKAENKVPCLFYEKNNLAARKLYEKLGFQPHGEWIVIELSYEEAGS